MHTLRAYAIAKFLYREEFIGPKCNSQFKIWFPVQDAMTHFTQARWAESWASTTTTTNQTSTQNHAHTIKQRTWCESIPTSLDTTATSAPLPNCNAVVLGLVPCLQTQLQTSHVMAPGDPDTMVLIAHILWVINIWCKQGALHSDCPRTTQCCDCGAELTADHITSRRCSIHHPLEVINMGIIYTDYYSIIGLLYGSRIITWIYDWCLMAHARRSFL